MKKITLSLLALSATLFSSEHYHDETTEREVYIQSQTAVNTIIADTPKTNLIKSDKKVGVATQYINAGDVSILNIPIGFQLNSSFGVEANIPLVSVTDYGYPAEDNKGLGDISLGVNYNFGSAEDILGLNIATLSYKTTTGDVDKGLGSDMGAITVSDAVTKNISYKYTLKALLAYTINEDDEILGNAYMAMIGGSSPCLLSNKITTSAKLTYYSVAEHTNQWGWTSGELTNADLWLQWSSDKFINNVPLGFGIKIPLVSEVDGNDKDKTVLFYLSASSLF